MPNSWHTISRSPFTVLDVTKWFGETSGGVRTYLTEKQRYVERREDLRHVLVIPGERDSVIRGSHTITYALRGPRIPTRRPYRFLLATRSFPRIVRDEAPHVIEVGSPFIVPWLAHHAARRSGIPLVNFFHSNFPKLLGGTPATPSSMSLSRAASPDRSLTRQLAESLAWRYMKTLDTFFFTTVVASNFSARVLRDAGIDRTVRIPLGVDLEHFHPRRKAHVAATRDAHDLPHTPLALYTGRFAAEKDIHVVIDAWRTIGKETGITLVLVGDGPAYHALQARARDARVLFRPYQQDRNILADLYAAADMYVAPGPLETFGLSALEAMASGLPVLSVDVGAVSELVTASDGGWLFEYRNPSSIVTAMRNLCVHDLPVYGARARAYAEREHAWDIVFDRLFALYHEAAYAGHSP